MEPLPANVSVCGEGHQWVWHQPGCMVRQADAARLLAGKSVLFLGDSHMRHAWDGLVQVLGGQPFNHTYLKTVAMFEAVEVANASTDMLWAVTPRHALHNWPAW